MRIMYTKNTGDMSTLKKINRRIRLLLLLPVSETLKMWRMFLSIKPYTLVEYPRLAKAYELLSESEEYNEVEGAIVECGTWNGGYTRLMYDISARYGKQRHTWLFDSFDGGPPPTSADMKVTGKMGKAAPNGASAELCAQAFAGVEQKYVHIVPGLFQDTFAKSLEKVGPIAYLHLDADFYEATTYCLDHLFDRVSPGGIIIFDDYSYFLGCQKAVDEFLSARKLSHTLVRTVQHSAYLRKIS
jgi:hypothetical protein